MSDLLHHCHAVDCPTVVPPIFLMCAAHWLRVPRPIRERVHAEYRPGQEVRKDPSLLWCLAADEAVEHVAKLEGRVVRLSFARAFYPPMAATGMGRTVRETR